MGEVVEATMKPWKPIAILGVALVGLIILLAPVPAFAQSCALCYTQAAGSGSRMIQALKSGILILIVPPTFMSVGLIFVCYRKRNQTRDEGADESNRNWQDEDADVFPSEDW
ncbi:MAG: hypothetical protein WB562_02475 [Candidatus Sulfotelmatobacter sp.]